VRRELRRVVVGGGEEATRHGREQDESVHSTEKCSVMGWPQRIGWAERGTPSALRLPLSDGQTALRRPAYRSRAGAAMGRQGRGEGQGARASREGAGGCIALTCCNRRPDDLVTR